jgi:hypothetical protein
LLHRKVQLTKTKLNEQAQKDLGLKINFEGVDGPTIQARVTAIRDRPRHYLRDQQLGTALWRQRRDVSDTMCSC